MVESFVLRLRRSGGLHCLFTPLADLFPSSLLELDSIPPNKIAKDDAEVGG